MASIFSKTLPGLTVTLWAVLASAQEVPPDTIVVTASRVPQELRTIGSSVSVITSAEIDRFQERFALDALATTPGLDTARTGPAGGTASVFLRGDDSFHTLVLIDGVPVNDPSGTQSAFDFGRLLATDIERIEILRGPQSTLYGGDAVGGVVSVTTKQPTDGFHASGLAEFGSFGTRLFAGRLAAGQADAGAYLSVSQLNTDGFPAADERFGNHVNDGLEATQATAGGHVDPTDWLHLDVAVRSADSEAGYPNSFGPAGAPIDAPNEARTHERSGRVSATTTLFDGGFSGTLSVMDSVIRRHTLDTSFGEDIFDGERRKAEYLATVKPRDWLGAVAGLSWQQDRARSTFDMFRTTITRAGFGELQLQPIADLYLTAGGRIDDHSAFGPFRTYRVTAAYRIEATGTKLRGAVGSGFRAPSLFELYDAFSGNPALRPESSRGWEAGFDQAIVAGLDVKATYFDQHVDNRIDFNFTTNRYFNVGHARSRGVELEADADLTHALTVRAVYTYDQAQNLDTGTPLLRRPRHSASLIAAWQATDALDLTARLHAVSRRFDTGGHALSGYGLADLGLSYAVLPELTLEGRIENITDARYEEVYGYGTAGRSVHGGVSVAF
jgi:vitamin B12 transporter